MQTLAYGIDTAGQVVGGYVDSGQNRHGFLLSGDVYSTVDVPGAADNVSALGSIAAGHIVGVSGDANSVYGGYLRNAAGAFSPIGFPGADETDPIGINALGVITGFYVSGPISSASFSATARTRRSRKRPASPTRFRTSSMIWINSSEPTHPGTA